MNAEAVEAVSGKRALVIGGGIAGIQAALDLADARIPVTLVEKSPTIGRAHGPARQNLSHHGLRHMNPRA
jgi:heterodisulfide reductase subunit A-like polyferredoxin